MIVDEAHHEPSATYQAFITHFTCHKVLLTATPEKRNSLPIHHTSMVFRFSIEEGIQGNIIKLPCFLRYSDRVDDE